MKIKKRILMAILASVMVLSMTACSGGKSESNDTSKETKQSEEVKASDEKTEKTEETEETKATETSDDKSTDDIMKKLKEEIVEAYVGQTESGEYFYYGGNDDGSIALFAAVTEDSTDTMFMCGTASSNGSTVTITDDETGDSLDLTITDVSEDNSTMTVDFSGTEAVMTECPVDDMLNAVVVCAAAEE